MDSHRPTLTALAGHLRAADPDRARELLGLLDRALQALDPEAATAQALRAGHPAGDRIVVAALGKAAPAMARGAATVLGRRVRKWVVVSDHAEPVPEGAELLVSSHPLPGPASLEAGRRLLDAVVGPADHIILLVSGGGSALAEVPRPGVSLQDLVAVYDLLLREGVAIEDANVVRSHLSALKGGKLAAAATAPLTTIVLSDVGPRLDLVASGPSVTASSRAADAVSVLEGHGLTNRVPPAVLSVLHSGDPMETATSRVVSAGDGATAAAVMAEAGQARGVPTTVVTTSLRGEARETARWALTSVAAGEIGVMAGETTVTVKGAGRGGRNQEAALAAALALEGGEGSFVAVGTDGIDGPTDAAGGYVDGATAGRIRAAGIDPEAALDDNDSHTALEAAGTLIRTGPTGINVADLWLVDRRPP